MRAAIALLLSLLLSACLAAPEPLADPPADPPAPEIAVTVLADASGAADDSPAPAEPATAEDDDPRPPDPPAAAAGPPAVPPALTAEARACAARGGTLRPRGEGGLWACIRNTRDGGRSCRTGAECEGLCLARSRTCAPFEPLFGCHEVLDRAGRPQTLCRE